MMTMTYKMVTNLKEKFMSRQRNNKVQLKAKCLTKSSLKQITPITPNPVKTFEAFQRNKHLMLHGCAVQ